MRDLGLKSEFKGKLNSVDPFRYVKRTHLDMLGAMAAADALGRYVAQDVYLLAEPDTGKSPHLLNCGLAQFADDDAYALLRLYYAGRFLRIRWWWCAADQLDPNAGSEVKL